MTADADDRPIRVHVWSPEFGRVQALIDPQDGTEGLDLVAGDDEVLVSGRGTPNAADDPQWGCFLRSLFGEDAEVRWRTERRGVPKGSGMFPKRPDSVGGAAIPLRQACQIPASRWRARHG